jgi:hypothetical protein
MKKFLDPEEEVQDSVTQPGSVWLGRILGFLGSAVILWIALRALGPVLTSAWGISWLQNTWIRAAVVVPIAALMTVVLSRIEGTIWAQYYVIIGYLLSLALIVWIVLRLLHYI